MLPLSYALRNLLRDPWKLFQKVSGATMVVFLIYAAASFNEGMESVLRASGSPENVILLGAGSEESVERSEVAARAEDLARAGIRGIETRMGVPAVSGEIHYMGRVGVGISGGDNAPPEASALLRGITPGAFEVHREVRLLEGDYPGSGEVIAGRLAWHALGLEEGSITIGATITFEGQAFRVVGIFEAPGTVMESELWMDRTDLMTLGQRDALSCVVIRLAPEGEFSEVDLFTKQRLDLELAAIRETDYYGNLSRFYGPIRAMTWLTAGLIAAGAVFGGLNLLYAAFASRIRELATLQAVGFSRGSILLSLVQESLLATLSGTVLASLLALALLDGVRVPFSMGTFQMSMTPAVVLYGLGTGVLLGSLGALPPALRCLGAPLPSALRSS